MLNDKQLNLMNRMQQKVAKLRDAAEELQDALENAADCETIDDLVANLSTARGAVQKLDAELAPLSDGARELQKLDNEQDEG